jgi:uncharacterized protein (DUF1778 family)
VDGGQVHPGGRQREGFEVRAAARAVDDPVEQKLRLDDPAADLVALQADADCVLILLLRLSVTEYAGSRLVEDARKTIAEHNVTRMTDRDRDIFPAMLDADTEPDESLRQAFRDVD